MGQLLRSGTSPYPNHGEAQAAEPPKDFIRKFRISLLNVCFLIRCWTFDVQCSMFIFKNNLSLMGSSGGVAVMPCLVQTLEGVLLRIPDVVVFYTGFLEIPTQLSNGL